MKTLTTDAHVAACKSWCARVKVLSKKCSFQDCKPCEECSGRDVRVSASNSSMLLPCFLIIETVIAIVVARLLSAEDS